ncbi:O-antigen ligase family protein [Xanthomarina gelatinilytica]|uniref:O-antigen ligase family protein n=1 Tax=Xanthomarina gelatinilytica TaxID=1137281 RepID=UPI003AA8F892
MNFKTIINHPDLFSYLIALILSTLLIGYAPSSIALGIFLFFVLIYVIINKPKITIEPMLLLPIGLYVFFCASYFWSVDPLHTIKGLGRLVPLLIFPFAFSSIPKFTLKQYHIILSYFSISNVILGVLFIITASINFIHTKSFSVFTYHELVLFLDLNAIYVSVFFSISYFYLLSKQHKKSLEKGAIVFLGILILLLSSKMMIVAFVLCNIIFLVFYKGISYLKNYKTLIVILALTTVFTATSHQVIKRFIIESTTDFNEVLHKEKFNKIYPWTGSSIRILQLRILKDQIQEENIFWKGFGLYASRNNLKERHINFNTYYGYHKYNYHNMYAQILSELGIFGLLFLLLILILNTKKAIQSKNFLFVIFNVIFIMIFLTESLLWVHRGIFLFTILFCLLNRTKFNHLQAIGN